MLPINQNMLKLCLLMALLGVFSPVGFAQQVLVLPSQSINTSEYSDFTENDAIVISTQNILGSENLTVSVSIKLEVMPTFSAPVIKVDNILYATDGELVYRKNDSQKSWEIAVPSEQPVTIASTFARTPINNQADLSSAQHDLPAGFSEQAISDVSSFNLEPVLSLDGNLIKSSTSQLPSDFIFQFSIELTSVFYQDSETPKLDIVLGNEIQISFVKENDCWVATDWLVLEDSDPTSVNDHSRAGPLFSSYGFLPGSFSFLRNLSSTPLVNPSGLYSNSAIIDFIPPVNHIASGWSPTLGAVYDRNVGINLIFCSNLQTFSSFYTATLIFDNSNSRPADNYPLFSENLTGKFSLFVLSFKGTLT